MVEAEHAPVPGRPRPRPAPGGRPPQDVAAAPKRNELGSDEPGRDEPASEVDQPGPDDLQPDDAQFDDPQFDDPQPDDQQPDDAQPDTGSAPSRAPRSHRARNAGLLSALVIALAAVVAVVLVLTHGDSGGSAGPMASSSANDTAATLTDSSVADAFLAGATTDIVAVTTYDYRSLDTALSNGEQVTTGAYRTSFRAALSGSLAAEAKRVHRVQTFTLLAAGIGSIAKDGTSAKVLIFGVQSVTDDTTRGKAKQTTVTLTATMQRRANRYLVARLSSGQNAGLPGGTAGLRAAAEAGRSEVAAVLTLRHDHFDADYNAALSGAVEPLRGSLTSQAAATRKRITAGRYDLAGTVTAVAVQRALGDTLVLLVAATGTRTAAGKTSVVVDGRYRVTVVRVGGRWVTSSIDAVSP